MSLSANIPPPLFAMNFKKAELVLWIVLSLFCTALAHAETVTLDFAGSVLRVDNPDGSISSSIRQGDAVSVSLRYDTTTPDFYPDDPTRGTYQSPGWLKFQVNEVRFETTTFVQIDVLHGFNGQELFQVMTVNDMSTWPTPALVTDFRQLFLAYWQSTPTFTLFSNDSLPTSLDFTKTDLSHSFALQYSEGSTSGFGVYFGLVQVPEPGFTTLLAVSLAAVCVHRRVRSLRK
jgi:hypothetical protein